MGRGIQEGYICALSKNGFGFIAKDRSSERGIYFHQSDMKGTIPWGQLCRGTCVHFKVEENEKGCIAKEVSIIVTQVGKFPFFLAKNLSNIIVVTSDTSRYQKLNNLAVYLPLASTNDYLGHQTRILVETDAVYILMKILKMNAPNVYLFLSGLCTQPSVFSCHHLR